MSFVFLASKHLLILTHFVKTQTKLIANQDFAVLNLNMNIWVINAFILGFTGYILRARS
jgi:hypothetical protein